MILLGMLTAYSQTATAMASVTVVNPGTIVKTSDMDFGYLFAGTTSGTATLAASLTYSRTTTGGVTAGPVSMGAYHPAVFILTAKKSFMVLSIPTTVVTLTRVGGTQTMTATAFTSNPSGNGWHHLTGTQEFPVGATLNVAANQAPGVYVSGNFTVTVDFN